MNKNPLIANGKTKIIEGSILNPESSQLRLIIVPTSLSGKPEVAMGGSLYDLLNKRWMSVKADYKGWYARHIDFKLGSVYTTAVQTDIWVLHMLCLDKDGKLDKKALDDCIKKVKNMAKDEKASVHISTMITDFVPDFEEKTRKEFVENGVSTYFYIERNAK